MGKSLISDLRKVTITGVLNADNGTIENEGEVVIIEDTLKKFDGYDIEIKLSVEDNSLEDEEEE